MREVHVGDLVDDEVTVDVEKDYGYVVTALNRHTASVRRSDGGRGGWVGINRSSLVVVHCPHGGHQLELFA